MIDRQTVEKIKDAANIVEVVQDYVTLKRSGANFKGLCPFHNEKTPSFIVTPARGTCHCFGCGKGGNPISFLMEIEQITYPDALRRLAERYHIPIQEREMTEKEREEQSLREALLIVNDWAASYFNDLLRLSQEGNTVGREYFRQRGFRDDIIHKFRLGYDLEDRRALGNAAAVKGYNSDYVVQLGLCFRNDRGQLIDRYSGRVVFPWINSAGKVVGFSARVLDQRTKGVEQKYVNSPDSDIFHKDRELYGLFQAKQAISREGVAYIVEGQADVIAMHQCGVENVVAGSGTALSAHQIHLLHRFAPSLTLIYDDDAAGHHAAMEGIDKVLAEGMNVRIVVLPDGDDPDSFAQRHTAEEFREYIQSHQVDFIQYKTSVLLNGQTDPQVRAAGVSSIVRSISYVRDPILRDTYLRDTAQQLGVKEATLIQQLNALVRERQSSQRPVAAALESREAPTTGSTATHASAVATPNAKLSSITRIEKMLVQLVVCHGERIVLQNVEDEEGNVHHLTMAQFLHYSLSSDQQTLRHPLFQKVLMEAVEHSSEAGWKAEPYFLSHENIEISTLAAQLVAEHLEVNEAETVSENEIDRKLKYNNETESLRGTATHLLLDFKREIVTEQLRELQQQLRNPQMAMEERRNLMGKFTQLSAVRNALAKKLGSGILP